MNSVKDRDRKRPPGCPARGASRALVLPPAPGRQRSPIWTCCPVTLLG
ncbi:MAG: hypothetical protein IJG86_05080 [Clostridia bacterium]|nr:hypothetical protein [Clostridia bacterium]